MAELINVENVIHEYVRHHFNAKDLDSWIDSIILNNKAHNAILHERKYAIENKVAKQAILFLGLNPSYDPQYKHGYYSDYNHAHFKRGRDTIDSLNIDLKRGDLVFAHHDLFFVRETDHNVVMKMMQADKEFFHKQIELTMSVLSKAQPVLIVAENAELFNLILRGNGKEFHYEQTWNEDLGVDFFQFDGWEKPVPIIFTGMLSVLNNGSYYSLRWHMRHILRSLNTI